MFGAALKKAQSFRKNERGTVLLLFLILIVPILLLVAVAIDFSQFLAMKRQLQGAVDAAALNLATQAPTLDQTQLDKEADTYVQVNFAASNPAGAIVPNSVQRHLY